MTSSAVVSSVIGTVSPSAWAVLRLIAISNFVGVCIGRSIGFSPRKVDAIDITGRAAVIGLGRSSFS
jgi:hypothetical protein